jgi:translocator protein
MVPMPVFYAVGAAYYTLMGAVLYRSIVRRNGRALASGLSVLVANEVWKCCSSENEVRAMDSSA